MKTLIGSISHGTLRPQDLLEAFLDFHGPVNGPIACVSQTLILDTQGWLEEEERDEEIGSELVNEWIDRFNEIAPPYFYFGAHPGDGSDFGFWLSEEWRDEAELIVSDLSEVPEGYTGEAFVVSDHGNLSLYSIDANGNATEIWSIV